jgi:hypothetical protein
VKVKRYQKETRQNRGIPERIVRTGQRLVRLCTLDRALGSPAALYAQVGEVTADSERDRDDRQVYEGKVSGSLQIVDVPGEGTRYPQSEHHNTDRQKDVRRAPRQLHRSLSVPDVTPDTSNTKQQRIYFL